MKNKTVVIITIVLLTIITLPIVAAVVILGKKSGGEITDQTVSGTMQEEPPSADMVKESEEEPQL